MRSKASILRPGTEGTGTLNCPFQVLRVIAPIHANPPAQSAISPTRSVFGSSAAIKLARAGCGSSILMDQRGRDRRPWHIPIRSGTLKLTIDNAGRLKELRMLRYGNPGGLRFGNCPFGGIVEEERTLQDLSLRPPRLGEFESASNLVRPLLTLACICSGPSFERQL